MNLLLIDDEIFTIDALLQSIEKEKLKIDQIFSCYNIQDAKELIDSESIDLIICDIEMPHGNGLELLEWIQTESLNIISILLTSHPSFDYASQAINYGVFSYILKPFDITELNTKISTAIKKIKALKSNSLNYTYSEHWKVNKPLIQEQFWYQLITGYYNNSELSYIKWNCINKEIDFSENTLLTPLLFCITSFYDKSPDFSLISYSLKNVITELFLSPDSSPPVISLSQRYYIALLPENSSLTVLQQSLTTMQQFFYQNFQITLQYFSGTLSDYKSLSKQVSFLQQKAEIVLHSNINAQEPVPNKSTVEQVISLIKNNPSITTEELSKKIFLSYDYIAKLFKKEVGITISEYILTLKMDEAKYLLSQTPISISRIATHLSYSNFSYFSKVFRQSTGYSPGEYRKLHFICK